MKNTLRILVLVAVALTARGEMLRVTGIVDGSTIDARRSDGSQLRMQLAGVEVLDEAAARELLRWTIGSAWIMGERDGDAWRVWRSPDALFINSELTLRGVARATSDGIAPAPQAMVTYLGELDLGVRSQGAAASAPKTKKSSSAAASLKTPAPKRSRSSRPKTAARQP